MKKYIVKTQFIFEGNFFVNADDKYQAKEYIEKQCGLTLRNGIHSTLSDDVIDWDFSMHSIKQIGRIKEMRIVMYKGFPVYCSCKKKRRLNAK